MIRNGNAKIKRIYNGGKKIRRVYNGNRLIWSAGNIATYVIDGSRTYRREVESGENCLAAKYLDFEYKNAWKTWTFRGWKMEQDASLANLITQKIMGDDPITIYSVYSTPVTLSYNANGGSGSMQSKTSDRYYNNGLYKDAPFTLDKNTFTKTGYTFSKWAVGGVSNPQYEAGAKIALATNATAYATWNAVGGYKKIWGELNSWGEGNNSGTTGTFEIDLSGFKKIFCSCIMQGNNASIDFKVDGSSKLYLSGGSNNAKTGTIDVSGMTGNHKLSVSWSGDNETAHKDVFMRLDT